MPAVSRPHSFPLTLLLGGALALSIGIVGNTGPALGQSNDASSTPSEAVSPENQSLEQAWENFEEFTAEQALAAEDAANNLLAAMDRELEELDARMESAGEETRQALQARREDLRQQRMALAQRLDELGEDSESAWDQLTDGIAEGYDRFTDAVAEAWQELT